MESPTGNGVAGISMNQTENRTDLPPCSSASGPRLPGGDCGRVDSTHLQAAAGYEVPAPGGTVKAARDDHISFWINTGNFFLAIFLDGRVVSVRLFGRGVFRFERDVQHREDALQVTL